MSDGSRQFRFIGKDRPDTIVGERVVVRTPLPLPSLGPQRNISVHGFCRHVEKQVVQALTDYGRDCDNFELCFDEHGKPALIFTRPMDRLELTHYRTVMQKQQAAAAEQLVTAKPEPLERTLPDPSLLPRNTAVAADVSG